jgi:hypothetical protein
MGGGDTVHNWNIDATGANDPAMVQAQVQRGIQQAFPHFIASSVAANRELGMRRPTTQR